MECNEVIPGIEKLMNCLRERIGNFSALLTGSWARGENRGFDSDVDLIIFAKEDPRAELCCLGLPYECDLIFVEPNKVMSKLEGGFMALIEGLWYGKWVCRDENAIAIERTWKEFLKQYTVKRREDYWVIRRRGTYHIK